MADTIDPKLLFSGWESTTDGQSEDFPYSDEHIFQKPAIPYISIGNVSSIDPPELMMPLLLSPLVNKGPGDPPDIYLPIANSPPLSSDDEFQKSMDDLNDIYTSITLHLRLLRTCVREVFSGSKSLDELEEEGLNGMAYTELFIRVEESSGDVVLLLRSLQQKRKLFARRQAELVDRITGPKNPWTCDAWPSYRSVALPGEVRIDLPKIGTGSQL